MPTLSKANKRAVVSQNEARRRKEVALATLRELEVAEKTGRLVSADAMNNAWITVAGKIRAAVLRIPDKCSPALAAAQDAQETRGILQTECEAILRVLSSELLQAN